MVGKQRAMENLEVTATQPISIPGLLNEGSEGIVHAIVEWPPTLVHLSTNKVIHDRSMFWGII